VVRAALLVDQVAEVVQSLTSNAVAQHDMMVGRVGLVVSQLADAAAAGGAADPAAVTETVSANKGGFFGPLAAVFESFLKILDAGLSKAGIPYSYGFAIILLTIIVKVATFPLSKQQVESTLAMQAIAPQVKALQEQYKGRDQQEMQIKVAELYKKANVNPLAGCLPTLATLPVWIGLYRALSNVADEGLLTEGWFWIPSLAGPTTLASRQAGGGFSWLFPFENGAPPIGWHDAIAYLVLPVALIISQFITQKILSPPQADTPEAQQSNAILKFLPLMIGYFSLNVPSGLTLYWFTNNLLTTGQQLWLRKNMKTPELPTTGTVVKNRTSVEDLAPKSTGAELGARRSSKQQTQATAQDQASTSSSAASSSSGSSRKKGDKFKKIKAQEAARRAAKIAGSAAAVATGAEPASASQGVDAAVGEATSVAKTGTTVKTEEKDKDLKVPDSPPQKNNSSSNGAAHSEDSNGSNGSKQ
jgi:YidC/Oxa1 family membrane protein insertase